MTSISISGPFTRVKCASISADQAKLLKTKAIELYEIDELIEGSESLFSLYGADYDTVVVRLKKTLDYSASQEGWYSAGRELDEPPKELFLEGTSFDLAKLGKKDVWAILVENYEGDETRDFKGKFEQEKLQISRVNLRVGQSVLADVIQVNYEGSKIVDNTEGAFDSLFVLEKGKLNKLDY